MCGLKKNIRNIVKVIELIRKILREQTDVSGFCIPVNGWMGKSLTRSQKFDACRNKKVKKLAEDSCSKCEKCRKGDKCIKCKCCRKHKGNDLTVNSGTPLLAAHDGQVTIASMTHDPNGYGGMIEIKHADGIKTRYGHCSQIDVEEGEDVNRGQVIGKSGGDSSDPGNGNSSHAHLHYEVIRGGKPLDPITDGYLNVECGDPVDDIVVIDDEDPIDNDKKDKKYKIDYDGYKPDCRGVLSTKEVKMDTLQLIKLYQNGFMLDDNGDVVHETKFFPDSIGNMDRFDVNGKGVERYATQNGITDGGDDISIANSNIWVDCRLNSVIFNHINDNDITYG